MNINRRVDKRPITQHDGEMNETMHMHLMSRPVFSFLIGIACYMLMVRPEGFLMMRAEGRGCLETGHHNRFF